MLRIGLSLSKVQLSSICRDRMTFSLICFTDTPSSSFSTPCFNAVLGGRVLSAYSSSDQTHTTPVCAFSCWVSWQQGVACEFSLYYSPTYCSMVIMFPWRWASVIFVFFLWGLDCMAVPSNSVGTNSESIDSLTALDERRVLKPETFADALIHFRGWW